MHNFYCSLSACHVETLMRTPGSLLLRLCMHLLFMKFVRVAQGKLAPCIQTWTKSEAFHLLSHMDVRVSVRMFIRVPIEFSACFQLTWRFKRSLIVLSVDRVQKPLCTCLRDYGVQSIAF